MPVPVYINQHKAGALQKGGLTIKIIPGFGPCNVSHDTGKDFYSPRKVISMLQEDIFKLHNDFEVLHKDFSILHKDFRGLHKAISMLLKDF